MSNHLSQSHNPYLLQHAKNPVWWFPWGEAAFQKAQVEQKLIFLSIGYSACHWCHVMEHESFESPEIAQLMNADYISIKVDREEHPDVDHLYMEAIHAMGARGGWPLSMFLTPDRKPFYGGTYFPKDNFAQLLSRMADIWKHRNEDVLGSAEKLAAHLKNLQHSTQTNVSPPLIQIIGHAAHDLRMNQDPVYGGFSEAPKFPPNFQISFLRRMTIWLANAQRERPLNTIVTELLSYGTEFRSAEMRTLNAMAGGGLFDHLEGGFFRYAVDREWTIPHFEKMLYNQALNLISLVEAKDPGFDSYIRKTISYLQLRLQNSGGAFFASEDADSSEKQSERAEEGIFYVWKEADLRDVLDSTEFASLSAYFEITPDGNFEDSRIHLRRKQSELQKPPTHNLERALERLRVTRSGRPRPFRDEKVLSSWNGLMVTSLALAAQHGFESVELAKNAATWIWNHLWKTDASGKSVLFRRAMGSDVQFLATLEDYAFLIQGYLGLFVATLDPIWFTRSRELQKLQDEFFWDPETFGYFLTSREANDLPFRTKDFTDQATPNANAVSHSNLMMQFRLTGDESLRTRAMDIWKAAESGFIRYPLSQSSFVGSAIEHTNLAEEWVMIVPDHQRVQELRLSFAQFQQPGRMILILEKERSAEVARLVSILQDKAEIEKIYICQNFSCQLPVTISDFLRSMIPK